MRVYQNSDLCSKLREFFLAYFVGCSLPTQESLLWAVLGIVVLTNVPSVRFLYMQFLRVWCSVSLNAMYYLFRHAKNVDPDRFAKVTMRIVLSLIPEELRGERIFLSLDDSLVPKFGTCFECVKRLFDHADHTGQPYKNGHCFVCLNVSVLMGYRDGSPMYLTVPLRYQMWKPEGLSKLDIGASMIRSVLEEAPGARACLLCDAWYTKGAIVRLYKDFDRLDIIGAVRTDTVLFGLKPPATGKRGRPRKWGDRLSLDKDFVFVAVPDFDYRISCRRVLTKLFGSDFPVWAVASKSKSGSKRLILSTIDPGAVASSAECGAGALATAEDAYAIWIMYKIRWSIEVTFYEHKTFWDLCHYKLRSARGIERLINLTTIVYASTRLLPYIYPEYAEWSSMSPQQVRFEMGGIVRGELTFASLLDVLAAELRKPEKNKLLRKKLARILNDSQKSA